MSMFCEIVLCFFVFGACQCFSSIITKQDAKNCVSPRFQSHQMQKTSVFIYSVLCSCSFKNHVPMVPRSPKKNRPTFQMLCHFCWGFLYLLHQNHPKPSRSAQGSEELGAKSLSHGWSKASAAVSRCARSFCSSAAMKARPSWLTSSQLRALLGTYHGESPCNPHKCTRLNLPLSGARNMYKAL